MKTRVLSVLLIVVLLTATLAFSVNAALPAGYSQTEIATWGTCPCCETPCSQITWTPLSSITSTNRSLGTGHYYLTQDVACATFMYPKSGNTITINLNGYTLSRSNARPILMTSNVVLNLWNGNLETDRAGENGNAIGPDGTSSGYKVNLYNTNVTHTGTATGGTGLIYMDGGELNLHGTSTISGGRTSGNGGNVHLINKAVMNMYDNSHVSNGKVSSNSGGNICLDAATLNMYGDSSVTGGESGYTGGNIRAKNASDIKMHGNSSVSGGKSTLRGGGNIQLDAGCTLEMADTAKLTGGTAASGYTGANIAVAAGATATMNGGTMEGTGDAVVVQGTLNVDGSAKVTATITGKLVVKKDFTGNVTIARDDAVWGYSIPDIGNDVALPTARAEAETGYVNAGTIRYANKQTDIRSYADDTKLYYSVADMGGATWNAQYKTITMFYETGAAAIANSVAPNVAILYNDMDKATVSAGNTRIVDLNGHTVAELTNNGTLSLVDSANDTMDADACGEVTKLTNNGTLQQDVTWNSKRYVTILEDNGIASAHRLELRLSYVTFRPAAFGFYYKATFNADDVLADKITGYGVALSLAGVPDASVPTKTEMDDFAAVRGTDVKFGGLFGIMKESNGAQVNAENGMTKIYANCYVKIGDLVILADNENVGKKAGDEGFTGVGKSLFDVLISLNDKMEELDGAQLAAIEQFKQELTKMGVAWPEAGAETLTTIPTAA